MVSILDSNSPLLRESALLIPLLLGLALLTAVAGRRLLRRSNLRSGKPSCQASTSDDADHREVLGQLQDRLPAGNDRETEPTIVELLSQIVDVNATLHTRLESAEGTLENQAAEITAYKSEARTDPMTGLANRRVFDERLRDRLAEWQRNEVPVSVLLVDIDHFKRFNDSYGHLAGDEVLTQVARLLQASMSEGDLVSRIGGEEFAIIIDVDSPRAAEKRAEHARREIEQADCEYENQHLNVTVSMGIADARAAENAAALVKRADVALYASKSAGRNNVHKHDGHQAIPLSAPRSNVNPASGFATKSVAQLTETKEFGAVCHELRQRLVAVAAEEVF